MQMQGKCTQGHKTRITMGDRCMDKATIIIKAITQANKEAAAMREWQITSCK